jgi:hypothetical protein
MGGKDGSTMASTRVSGHSWTGGADTHARHEAAIESHGVILQGKRPSSSEGEGIAESQTNARHPKGRKAQQTNLGCA